ncbi:hypothetical protein B0H21DRAFT_821343 [Amylocystis lapponica]|nr:hypothetical protein B0H21DRAFT_821343 [Amylocystis lapponica]
MAHVTYGPDDAAVAVRPIASNSRRKAPQLSLEQRKEMIAKSQAKHANLEADLAKWYEDSVTFSRTLSEKYGKKPDHYLNLMFTGGVKLGSKRKANAFNAWSHHLAEEAKEATAGEHRRLPQSDEGEKAQLIAQLEEEKASLCEKLDAMLFALKKRTGVEGFYCIVAILRVSRDPRWYFTTSSINEYLRRSIKGWDIEHIGSLAEAFAVAGCDFMTFLHSSKDKADWIKVISVTGSLQCCTSLPPLRTLLEALKSGECRFVRLSAAERAAKEKDYDRRVEAGEVTLRKKRKDAGGKHAKSTPADDDSSSSEDGAPRPSKRRAVAPKSAEFVEEDHEEQEGGGR